jgi:superfamily II DNA helicase RecQ
MAVKERTIIRPAHPKSNFRRTNNYGYPDMECVDIDVELLTVQENTQENLKPIGKLKTDSPDMDPLKILQQQFGYSSFRLHQEAIIQSVLKKKDTFVLMPTGGGKSICYQIPALIFDGLALVVSPLIALMKDQVDALKVNGIEAAYINSTQSYQEQEAILAKARSKQLKLLYLAPERLLGNSASFLKTLTSFNISLVAIDEAHCISHWGHDFRPEYLMLAKLKQSLANVPVIALTATAEAYAERYSREAGVKRSFCFHLKLQPGQHSVYGRAQTKELPETIEFSPQQER